MFLKENNTNVSSSNLYSMTKTTFQYLFFVKINKLVRFSKTKSIFSVTFKIVIKNVKNSQELNMTLPSVGLSSPQSKTQIYCI